MQPVPVPEEDSYALIMRAIHGLVMWK